MIGVLLSHYLLSTDDEELHSTEDEETNKPKTTDIPIQQMLNELKFANHKILLLKILNLLENKTPKEIKEEFLPSDNDKLENIRKILASQYPNHKKFAFGEKAQKAVNEVLKKYRVEIPDN